jgi:hypothetical protein
MMQTIKDVLLLRIQLTRRLIVFVWMTFVAMRCLTLWDYLEATYSTTQSLGPWVLLSLAPRLLDTVVITAVVGVFLKVAVDLLSELQR